MLTSSAFWLVATAIHGSITKGILNIAVNGSELDVVARPDGKFGLRYRLLGLIPSLNSVWLTNPWRLAQCLTKKPLS